MENVFLLENIKNVCRLCFEMKSETSSLFLNKDDLSIYEKLAKEAKLNIHIDDGGPMLICGQCFEEFNVFIKFLDKCKRANELFYQFKQNLKDTSHFDSNTNYSIQYEEKNTEEGASSNEDCKQDNLTQNKNNPKLAGAPYTCQVCCKVFTRNFNYKLHLKSHSGEAKSSRQSARRPCPTPGCEKSFTSITNLNTHIRKHTGERPFSCGDCGKTFGSKNTLNDHMRIHTGVKPYVCPACGKQFATNKLAAHLRTHGARRHACAACARRFVDARAVRLHARTHAAPARAHACAHCAARYSHKQSLNKHLRTRHALQTS